jgi:hypothetical protein
MNCAVDRCTIATQLHRINATVVTSLLLVAAAVQIMSTEDVQDQRCAAFDAMMDCIHALISDDPDPLGTVRIILPHGQVGAIMGKAGSTIK